MNDISYKMCQYVCFTHCKTLIVKTLIDNKKKEKFPCKRRKYELMCIQRSLLRVTSSLFRLIVVVAVALTVCMRHLNVIAIFLVVNNNREMEKIKNSLVELVYRQPVRALFSVRHLQLQSDVNFSTGVGCNSILSYFYQIYCTLYNSIKQNLLPCNCHHKTTLINPAKNKKRLP